jgi:6-phosphogluconolactonase (cycloisomerase 2 family)
MLVEPYLYVANERSDTVAVFRVDPVTGMPAPTGDMLATPTPTCLVPYPAGQ